MKIFGDFKCGELIFNQRIYMCDKDVNVSSFALSQRVIEYETLILRGELDEANEILGEIQESEKGKIARFLEGQGYKEMALEVATDPEHRFELALALQRLDIATEIAKEADVEHKWKTVGDAALAAWDVKLAGECFSHAKDLGSLLLLHTATSDAAALRALAAQAADAAANNVAFSCLWQLADVDGCIDLLVRTGRVAEAVMFAKSHRPSRCRELVALWKQGLDKDGKGKVARLLGVPPGQGEGEDGDADMFPEWEEYLRLEKEGPPPEDEAAPAEEDDEDAEEDGEEE